MFLFQQTTTLQRTEQVTSAQICNSVGLKDIHLSADQVFAYNTMKPEDREAWAKAMGGKDVFRGSKSTTEKSAIVMETLDKRAIQMRDYCLKDVDFFASGTYTFGMGFDPESGEKNEHVEQKITMTDKEKDAVKNLSLQQLYELRSEIFKASENDLVATTRQKDEFSDAELRDELAVRKAFNEYFGSSAKAVFLPSPLVTVNGIKQVDKNGVISKLEVNDEVLANNYEGFQEFIGLHQLEKEVLANAKGDFKIAGAESLEDLNAEGYDALRSAINKRLTALLKKNNEPGYLEVRDVVLAGIKDFCNDLLETGHTTYLKHDPYTAEINVQG
ncbi:MAG: hypothetical protein NTV88_06060 [Candidatus Micrarchaeota archaeon]|nr:hypothetical protein [Candidatus Micrarchaeota archaeon]